MHTKKLTLISALVIVDPSRAKEMVLAAYREAKASKTDAAKSLGCALNTYTKWIVELGLEKELLAIKKQAKRDGWHHDRYRCGGRPFGTTKSRKR